MRPEDRKIEEQFVRRLTPASKYYRFHAALRELTEYMLDHFTNVNYPDEMALIATIREGDAEQEIGVARYVRTREPDTAEIAVVVSDEWQGKGIGGKLLKDLRDLRPPGRHQPASCPTTGACWNWRRISGFGSSPGRRHQRCRTGQGRRLTVIGLPAGSLADLPGIRSDIHPADISYYARYMGAAACH